MSPLYTTSTNSRHFNPYLRRRQEPSNDHRPIDLHQVELGIVAGSPLNRNQKLNQPPPPPPEQHQQQLHNQHNQNHKAGGLFTKCVDWLFNPSKPKSSLSSPSPSPSKVNRSLDPPLNCFNRTNNQPICQNSLLPSQPSANLSDHHQRSLIKSLNPSAATSSLSSLPNHQNQIPSSPSSSSPSSSSITKSILNPQPSIYSHNQSKFNSLPHPKTRSSDKNAWFRSQSPFVISNHSNLSNSNSHPSLLSIDPNHQASVHPSSLSSNTNPKTSPTTLASARPRVTSNSQRRRPNTSHATLNIPLSSNLNPNQSSIPHRIFGAPSSNNIQTTNRDPNHHLRIRSVSPLRQLHSHRSTLSPSAQIIQSSTFSSLGRLNSPRRTLVSTIAQDDPAPTDLLTQSYEFDPSLSSQKRHHDQMSISPARPSRLGSRSQSCNLFEDGLQASKRQMFWDPKLGFLTWEHRAKLMREAELKLRQKEGRPFPTNEAEKILEVLEVGRDPTLGIQRSTAKIPKISVPTPSTSTQRASLAKHLQRSAFATNLSAIYEEQALHSNPGTIIAPINKKLEAERIKRLEEKKGQLRAELKRRKLMEESLQKRNRRALQEAQQPNQQSNLTVKDFAPSRALRSASVETSVAVEPTSPRRRSTRKVGKLTSSSSKAKVNQGRKSRSQSANEDESNEATLRSGRVTRSHQLASSLASDAPTKASNTKSSDTKRSSRVFKSIKSPSPIQEESEEASVRLQEQRDQPVVQDTTCLHPAVRSSSISLHAPLSSITKASATSSLRPGRTFSSRRHIKAKVFSAREEDLPPLNDEDDEEADEQNEKLKKIKLPTTFMSSFKLEKFTTPTQDDSRSAEAAKVNQIQESTSTSFQNDKSSSGTGTANLFGSSTLTPSSSSIAAGSSDPVSTSTWPSTFGASIPSGSTTENPSQTINSSTAPSPFFSLTKEPSSKTATSIPSSQPASNLSSNVFSRIPSDAPPPNFFSGLTSQPTPFNSNSSQDKPAGATPEPSSFSSQSNTGTSATGLFKSSFESNPKPTQTTLFGPVNPNSAHSTQSATQKSQSTSLFSFGTQSISQPTLTNESTITLGSTPSGVPTENEFSGNPPSSNPSSSAPTCTFGGGSNAGTSVFGSQNNSLNNTSDSASSKMPFTFGSQPSSSLASDAHQQLNTPLNGITEMMDSSTQPAPTTSTPSIFGALTSAPIASKPLDPSAVTSSTSAFNFSAMPPVNKPGVQFGTSTSSTKAPTFTFGASTTSTTTPNLSGGTTQTSGSSNPFGLPSASSSTSSPFTFGASTGTSNSSPFVFGANSSNSNVGSNSIVTPAPVSINFGQPATTVAPNNNSSSNVFSFGSSLTNPPNPGISGPTSTPAASSSGFGSSSGSTMNLGVGNPNSGGLFGMMTNNNGSGNTNPSGGFTFGLGSSSNTSTNPNPESNSAITTNGFEGGLSKSSHDLSNLNNGNAAITNSNNQNLFTGFGSNNIGSIGNGNSFQTTSLFGGGMDNKGSSLFGATGGGGGSGSLFGTSTTNTSSNTGNNIQHSSMTAMMSNEQQSNSNMMETNPTPSSIFGNNNNNNPSSSSSSSGTSLFTFGASTNLSNHNPSNIFGSNNSNSHHQIGGANSNTNMMGTNTTNSNLSNGIMSNSTSTSMMSNPSTTTPTVPAPGGFVFNIGTSDSPNASSSNSSNHLNNSTPITGRPVRKLPSSNRKIRR